MNFDHTGFYNQGTSASPTSSQHQHNFDQSAAPPQNYLRPQNYDPTVYNQKLSPSLRPGDFDSMLHYKLAALDQQQDTTSPLQGSFPSSSPPVMASNHPGHGPVFQPNFSPFDSPPPQMTFGELGPVDSFHLPRELQGGIGNISSRRPSYAAESFTRNAPQNPMFGGKAPGSSNKNSLASFAAANNFSINSNKRYGIDSLADSLDNFSLNSNLSDFQARRPSQLANFQPLDGSQQMHFYSSQFPPSTSSKMSPFSSGVDSGTPMSGAKAPGLISNACSNIASGASGSNSSQQNNQMKLDNKLMLKDQYIFASNELKQLFSSVSRYYHDEKITSDIVRKLNNLLGNEVVQKLTTFIKKSNNLTFNHKMLCLVINKNGKLDLLSYPSNSNIYLQYEDLVIVDGDRGKDMVMILEPLVSLEFAILFNFMKKIEHLKSLTITDSSGGTSVKNNHSGGTHSTDLDASAIINKQTNEDNEFIVNLPTKQVLRFATPKEVQKLGGKFLEEKKAYLTCFNKIKELGLNKDLTLINVEYQFDFKKLIFFYFANFKRIDFRGLIKDLFKIYKTRIWLCAVLPYDKPELYSKNMNVTNDVQEDAGEIPNEYELSNDQIISFSIDEFQNISSPTYFHSRNMVNLIDNLMEEVNGNFYGFNSKSDRPDRVGSSGRRQSHVIQPNFNPFGENEMKLDNAR